MASAAAAIDQAATPKIVDASLWWDSFESLFDELDATPLDSDLHKPLLEKVKRNRGWFVDSVARFKPPNEVSKRAIDSSNIQIGLHELEIKPDLKKLALSASSCLCLDEVQSYILVSRCSGLGKLTLETDGHEVIHLILLCYCIERQCLWKCIRRLFVQSLNLCSGSCATKAIREETLALVKDGLDKKLLSVLEFILMSASSDKMEIEFNLLWVEESLIEVNLALDIFFLLYYDDLCSCNIEQWQTIFTIYKGILSGSYNHGKLAVSADASDSIGHAKAQFLLILIETLDLEKLLGMVHDEVPFSEGHSSFSFSDIQELDALISSMLVAGASESGLLLLAWAVFLCLLMSLPESKDHDFLAEIDHIGYVRQAFQAAPLNYLLKLLQTTALRESDGVVSGYLSVLRTFISAFTAAYELNDQLEGMSVNLIVDILCEIYQSEESLSIAFWDKGSFLDGPIRSLLYLLESEFPYHSCELVRLLSALCIGAWPAECVYEFLDKISGITSLFELFEDSCDLNANDIIEAPNQLPVVGVEALEIPRGTRGYVLKVIDARAALVRWEYSQSGISILLLRFAQDFQHKRYEELFLTLNLLYRMLSANMGLCFQLMYIDIPLRQALQTSGEHSKSFRADVVNIICNLLVNLIQEASNGYLVSVCISILVMMLKCAPLHVVEIAASVDIFGADNNMVSGVLTGGLARMLLAEVENGDTFPLTTSVLDFTIQLVKSGAENQMVSALIAYALQYVFVSHLNWKCRSAHDRWRVTLKVLEVIKSCISASHFSHYADNIISKILLNDTSVQNILCRLLSVSAQTLESIYFNRRYDVNDGEDLQAALCLTLEIIHSMLEASSYPPIFVPAVLWSTNRSAPVATALSCLSSHNSAIQVAAAKVLSMACFLAKKYESESYETISFLADIMQTQKFRTSVSRILDANFCRDEDLQIAILDLLISAAKYQPAFLVAILLPEDQVDQQLHTTKSELSVPEAASAVEPSRSEVGNPIQVILNCLGRFEVLITRAPRLLLSFVNLLKAFWEGYIQNAQLLDRIRRTENFWEYLLKVLAADAKCGLPVDDHNSTTSDYESYRYQCQGGVLEIITHELFFQQWMQYDDLFSKQTPILKERLEPKFPNRLSKPADEQHKDVLGNLWENSYMEKLIKLASACRYDKKAILQAQVSVCLCIVDLIARVCSGKSASLSISLVKMISAVYDKLIKHPAFTSLVARYSLQGFSEGKNLTKLILNDLYYHLQGEVEGREIISGPFKELFYFLLELAIFESHECKPEVSNFLAGRKVSKYDIDQLQKEFGLELWDLSDLKASKYAADMMFLRMRETNSIVSIAESKHFMLKALLGIISIYEGNIIRKIPTPQHNAIPQQLVESTIKHVAKCLQETDDLQVPTAWSQEQLKHFASQAELLLFFSRILYRQQLDENRRRFLPLSVLLIKTSATGIRYLAEAKYAKVVHDKAVKVLFAVLLVSVQYSRPMAFTGNHTNLEVDAISEASLTCLGLLPFICNYAETEGYSDLSLATMDLILKGSIASNTWFPILQKHLQLRFLVLRIQQSDFVVSVPVILNFFLTVSCIKEGAIWLHCANVFYTIKVIFNSLWKEETLLNNVNTCVSKLVNQEEDICGLGLAVVASMIYSLGGDSTYTDLVDSVISYFLCDKAHIVFRLLSSLHFPVGDNSKKRAKTLATQTLLSLKALRNTEQALILICVLAKHHTWSKEIKEMDSQLREMCIHLLAFISKGVQRVTELTTTVPVIFLPTLKEEFCLVDRPSFINSKLGWFGVSALISLGDSRASESNKTSLVSKDQSDRCPGSQYSDMIAIQIYKITGLLLKFLCTQARTAVKRAEDVGFIDLAHFPELPTPEILHGIQDQTIAILTELCEDKRLSSSDVETQGVCSLLLQVLEKTLYLELCVSQSCGIRPVIGRLEDFSKAIKQLMKVAEQHSNLDASLRSLKQIIALCHPGLL